MGRFSRSRSNRAKADDHRNGVNKERMQNLTSTKASTNRDDDTSATGLPSTVGTSTQSTAVVSQNKKESSPLGSTVIAPIQDLTAQGRDSDDIHEEKRDVCCGECGGSQKRNFNEEKEAGTRAGSKTNNTLFSTLYTGYGAADLEQQGREALTRREEAASSSFLSEGTANEETGLLMVESDHNEGKSHPHFFHHGGHESVASIVDSVFSSVRSLSSGDIEAENDDAEKYLASSVWERALPERMFALIVTLAVEIPVLFMISGGSDRLCMLIGRRRYQLLIAFLPLTSAISGNCGLQASTLTTRAVSHVHVTKNSYVRWLITEVTVSGILGIGMGILLGLVAYNVAGGDLALGFTIFFAQFISIMTAGFTGTMAPLIFTFIFHRDSGKWGGPLETAIQDIVGSFAMVILSYRILLWMGPLEVDPNDICGA